MNGTQDVVQELIAWEQKRQGEQAREKLFQDTKRRRFLKEEARKEDAASLIQCGQELYQLDASFLEGLLSPEEHLQKCAAALEELKKRRVWNRALRATLWKMLL